MSQLFLSFLSEKMQCLDYVQSEHCTVYHCFLCSMSRYHSWSRNLGLNCTFTKCWLAADYNSTQLVDFSVLCPFCIYLFTHLWRGGVALGVEVTGHFMEVDFLLPPCRFQGSNVGSKLGTEGLYQLSHLPGPYLFIFISSNNLDVIGTQFTIEEKMIADKTFYST